MGAQERRAELAAQRETIAPWGRGRGVEPHVVAPMAIAQHQIDLRERQRRRAALLVGPAHGAAADGDFLLRKQPVGRAAVAAAVVGRVAAERHARHEDAPARIAPHIQLRAFQIQLLEAELEQRSRRNGRDHARQAQRLAALGVEQGDILQLDGGNQPVRAGGQRADAHGNPQSPHGPGFQRRTEISDSRHNPAMKHAPSGCQQQPEGQQQPQRPSSEHRNASEHSCGVWWRLGVGHGGCCRCLEL